MLSGALGWALDIGLWKPLRKRGLSIVQLMIVSIGLSLALRYVFQFFYRRRHAPAAGHRLGEDHAVRPGRAVAHRHDQHGRSASSCSSAVAYWLLRTRTGKATRAISDNPSLAAASGIDVDRVIRLLWVLGAALAGLSGILWAYFRPGIKWDMGWQILLLIFAAIVLGGLGTAFGALVGSIIVGLLVEVSTLWFPSDLKYVGAADRS